MLTKPSLALFDSFHVCLQVLYSAVHVLEFEAQVAAILPPELTQWDD
jgi:hypothetical protein